MCVWGEGHCLQGGGGEVRLADSDELLCYIRVGISLLSYLHILCLKIISDGSNTLVDVAQGQKRGERKENDEITTRDWTRGITPNQS
jgi:hypothetical protein